MATSYRMSVTLPQGWVEAVDGEGNIYYANAETGESSWDRPAPVPTATQEQPEELEASSARMSSTLAPEAVAEAVEPDRQADERAATEPAPDTPAVASETAPSDQPRATLRDLTATKTEHAPEESSSVAPAPPQPSGGDDHQRPASSGGRRRTFSLSRSKRQADYGSLSKEDSDSGKDEEQKQQRAPKGMTRLDSSDTDSSKPSFEQSTSQSELLRSELRADRNETRPRGDSAFRRLSRAIRRPLTFVASSTWEKNMMQGLWSCEYRYGQGEHEVKRLNAYQRDPRPGEPRCIVCGRFGEYFDEEQRVRVCSAECKLKVPLFHEGDKLVAVRSRKERVMHELVSLPRFSMAVTAQKSMHENNRKTTSRAALSEMQSRMNARVPLPPSHQYEGDGFRIADSSTVKRFRSDQRLVVDDAEPACAVCGRFGEYVERESGLAVCSLECKLVQTELFRRGLANAGNAIPCIVCGKPSEFIETLTGRDVCSDQCRSVIKVEVQKFCS